MISRWAGRKPAGEVLVYMLVSMTALLAVPWIDQAEKRFPFLFPLVLFGAGLLTRFEPGIPHTTAAFWLFALGWSSGPCPPCDAAVRPERGGRCGQPGVLREPRPGTDVIAGILLLLWLPGIPSRPGCGGPLFCWQARPCRSIRCTGWSTSCWLSSAPPSRWWRHWWQARRAGRCAAT